MTGLFKRVGFLLCRMGLHAWDRKHGMRHWHVECWRCGKRELWRNHDTSQGYVPINPNWPRGPTRTADGEAAAGRPTAGGPTG